MYSRIIPFFHLLDKSKTNYYHFLYPFSFLDIPTHNPRSVQVLLVAVGKGLKVIRTTTAMAGNLLRASSVAFRSLHFVDGFGQPAMAKMAFRAT